MTRTTCTTLIFSVLGLFTQAQTISQFTWESSPATTALVGPNGTAISTFASSSTGGVGGTNGLNAGPGRHDVNLVVPGSVFLVPGLDISVDFAKQENGASFFTIGGLDLGIAGGALYVKYIVKVAGSDVAVSATNKYTVNDANWHTYRFVYNNNTGIAKLYVDGAAVYTASFAAGTPLSWTGATDATIASGMDGGNSNIPTLDNLLVQLPPVTLPLQLVSFDVRKAGEHNELSWTTTGEWNLQAFLVQRSTDGSYFSSIGTVNYNGSHTYTFTDASPSATTFYRLKMTDIDGQFSYSPVKKVDATSLAAIRCYPNPTVDYVHLTIPGSVTATAAAATYAVITADGRILQTGQIAAIDDNAGSTVRQTSLNLASAPRGILFIRVQMDGGNQTFTIMKQ